MSKTFTLSQKTIPDIRKFHNLIQQQVPSFDGILREGDEYTIVLTVDVTQELVDQIEAITPPPALTSQEYVQKIIAESIGFGQTLISEFAAQNVLMGITQEGMTGTVRKRMGEVTNALSTGSLYDAITEARAIPPEHKDSKYITDVRLLQFINKIEAYLGLPLSSSL